MNMAGTLPDQPYTSEAIETIDPEPVSKLQPMAPAALDYVVKRCLAKDPSDRFQSADELRSALEGVPMGDAIAPATRPRPLLLRRAARLWLASILGVALGVGLPYLWPRPWTRPGTLPAEKRLVVLPFHDVGGGPAEQAFSSGLGEIVTTKLRQLEQFQGSLRVVSSSEILKERITSPKEARTAFGATLTLAGSVHWSKDRVVVTANLVETQNQLVLAARELEALRENASALPSQLVQQMAEMLRLELRPEARRELAAEESPAAGAYELYVQGRGYLQRYDRIENIENP